MTNNPEGNPQVDSYINIFKLLNESTDDYFFVCELESGQLYCSGPIQERYPIMQDGKNCCNIEDWYKIVYEKDLPGLKENLRNIISGKSSEHNMEYRILDKEGNRVWISCRGKCQVISSNHKTLLMGRVSDTVLVQKTDPLTGVFNANKMIEDMDEILKKEQNCYLLVVGIDNFKHINMKYGRTYGNQVLKQIAEIIEDNTDTAKIYRLEGDCFAVNLPEFSRENVEKVYERIRECVAEYCTISGGAVSYQEALTDDAGVLYQFAEEALDKAKKNGKNILSFFSIEDYERKLSNIELLEEMQHSIHNGYDGFFLYYQPQIYSQSHELFGAETLLRYKSSIRGMVSPAEFIPILEQSGTICLVGMWVLENALKQCKIWRQYFPDFHISVNVSYVQLEKENITQNVLKILEESGVPGNALTLEVTENMQLQDYPHFNKIFYQWKKHGIEISVDDFGTGYSSLGHLKSMEIDEIKIDRCFVSGIQYSAYNYRLLSNMIELARSSQIRVCCEGVETLEELHALEELHPDLLQGYLFSKPCSTREFEDTYICEHYQKYDTEVNQKIPVSCSKQTKEKNSLPVSEDNMEIIMEAFDDIIYISDLETHEMYYLNPAGRRLTGMYDYKGRKCYKVLQNRSDPCEFCTNEYLKKDVCFIWERNNPFLKRHFILKDKLIDWNGSMARLEYAIDVTNQELISQQVREQLDFTQIIVGCAQTLAEETDMKTAILRILSDIGHFYQADRAYLFEPSNEKNIVWNNTYEWYREGMEKQQDSLQGIPSYSIQRWLNFFNENKSVILSNIDLLQSTSPKEWEILNFQKIRRLIACPIQVNGKLAGFIGVNNPRHSIIDDTLIRTLTSFIANRIRCFEIEERLGELMDLRYRKIVSNVNQQTFLLDPPSSEMFEYNEQKSTIYFHTKRALLDGTALKESGFPQSWMDQEMVHPHFAEQFIQAFQNVHLRKKDLNELELLLKAKSGEYTWFRMKIQHLEKDEQDCNTILVLLNQANRERTMELELLRLKDFYKASLAETVAYAEVDLESGRLQEIGGIWKEFEEQYKESGQNFLEFLAGQLKNTCQVENRKGLWVFLDHVDWNGILQQKDHTQRFTYRRLFGKEWRWVELVMHIFQEQFSKNMFALLYLKDIDVQKRQELAQKDAAGRDPLTKVLNRISFEEKVSKYLKKAPENQGVLILLDIDNFKNINDSFGHLAGDSALKWVTDQLRNTFRSQDIIGRMGGDEFLVFIEGHMEKEVLNTRMNKLFSRLKKNRDTPISCSAGLVFISGNSFSYKEALRQADTALYRSKQVGKSRYCYADEREA